MVDAQADDDVDAFNPAISLTKLVDGEKQVTVPQGQQVSYTYAVSNSGNTPLGSVDLVDDTPPCQSPTRGADDPGNNDDVLDVAETWSYSCVANPTAAVVNTADVTADPLNPLDDNQPFLTPNPPVTDTDTAAVDVVNPDISLAKSVDPAVVLIGPNGDPEPVADKTSVSRWGRRSRTRSPRRTPASDADRCRHHRPAAGPVDVEL